MSRRALCYTDAIATSESTCPVLTPRQLEVLELLAKGLTNAEIGRVLGISSATAKRHVSAVISALDVTNRTEAATALHELGLGQNQSPIEPEEAVPGFGDRPAIAVLPFAILSAEPTHEYLADGLVEDMMSRLAAWGWFPVISRRSALIYKGVEVSSREASRTLGARYIVEGSVRPIAGAIRVAVQLADGTTGEQVWSERYDRPLEDLFALEGEIADTIVASLEPAIVRILGSRSLPKTPQDLGAWECLHRAYHRLSSLVWEDVRDARSLFERAIELDPAKSLAHAGLAVAGALECFHQRAPGSSMTEHEVIGVAETAISLDANEPIAHMALGWGRTLERDFGRAYGPFDRAIELNPSLAWAHWGRGTACAADSLALQEEAVVALRRAIRLSPRDPFLPWIWMTLGSAHTNTMHLAEGRFAFERARQLAPDQPHAYPMLAACLAAGGDPDGARALLDRTREIHPGYSPLENARRFGLDAAYDTYAGILASVGWQDPKP